jgi:hypothetical protein
MRALGGGSTPARPYLRDDDLGAEAARQAELGAVAFTDAHVLDEPPCTAVPVHGRPDIADGEDRDNPRVWSGAI